LGALLANARELCSPACRSSSPFIAAGMSEAQRRRASQHQQGHVYSLGEHSFGPPRGSRVPPTPKRGGLLAVRFA